MASLSTPEEEVSLAIACLKGNQALVETLLLGGADPNELTKKVWIDDTRLPHDAKTQCTLHPLISAAHEGHLAIVKRLVKAGADLRYKGTCGRTAFMIARERCHHEVAEFLERMDPDFFRDFSLEKSILFTAVPVEPVP